MTVIAAGAQCDPSLFNFTPVTTPGDSIGVTPTTEVTQPVTGSTPSPAASLLEQVALERINRARLLPAAEALRFGIAIDEGVPGQLNTTPKQPLAMNSTLRSAAAAHSSDMLQRNYFEHDTPEGVSPFDRMTTAGYLFAFAGENLAWRGTTGTIDPVATMDQQHQDLFVDVGIANRGHRLSMLNDDFREVGISVVRGSFTRLEDGVVFSDSIMQTADFGATATGATFVLGVVYDDENNNNEYDHGEGIANTAVTLGDIVKTTNQAGGYSFRVNEAGSFTLRFSLGATQVVTLGVGDRNVKIDLVDRNRLVVNLGVGMLN